LHGSPRTGCQRAPGEEAQDHGAGQRPDRLAVASPAERCLADTVSSVVPVVQTGSEIWPAHRSRNPWASSNRLPRGLVKRVVVLSTLFGAAGGPRRPAALFQREATSAAASARRFGRG
jgi:hypothetical protein